MENYLCPIIEMYDGREFIYDQLLITTDQDIYKVLEARIQNITDDEDDWSWEGKWWSSFSESAYTIGSVQPIPAVDVSVLSKHLEVVKV